MARQPSLLEKMTRLVFYGFMKRDVNLFGTKPDSGRGLVSWACHGTCDGKSRTAQAVAWVKEAE